MQAHKKLLDTPQEIVELAATLQGETRIALDTEFIRERTFFPIVALIQVATEKQSWLVDAVKLRGEDLRPLLGVFTNPKILKILHAAQADQECLFTEYGVLATPIFDTAVGGALCGFGDSVGLAKLLRELLNIQIQKGHARTDWTVRPMPEQLQKYAHRDVQHLHELTEKLFARLDKKNRRDWALELSARFSDPTMYEADPFALASRMMRPGKLDDRGFAALIELAGWREKRVRAIDIPRRRLVDDDTLVDLARTRPGDIEHLSAFRGLNKGELRISGEDILAAIKRAEALKQEELPRLKQQEEADDNEARVLEFLLCFMKFLAIEHEIALKFLTTSDDLLKIIRGKFTSVEELVEKKFLSHGAAALIGEELLSVLSGKIALKLAGKRLAMDRSH